MSRVLVGLKANRIVSLGTILLAAAACSPPNRTFSQVPFPQLQSLTCTFKMVHIGVLNPTYYREAPMDSLTLVIRNLDAAAGSAILEGNTGAERVEYRAAADKLHFIETTRAGNVTVTTVFAPPENGKPMPVIHSRHIAIAPANVAVSQFAGECVPHA